MLQVGDRIKRWSGGRSADHTPWLLGKGTVTRIAGLAAWIDWDDEEDNVSFGGAAFAYHDSLKLGVWTIMDPVERLAELA